MPLPVANPPFMQVCWLVPDLDQAIESWVETAGVGPWFWFESVPFVDGRYRGAPAEFPPVTAAMAYAGDLQIELVRQDGDEPGVFRDLYPRGQYGLHHFAQITREYEAERDAYIASGSDLVFEGVAGTSRTSWVDTSAKLGFMTELLEPSQTRDAWFGRMHDAAAGWDGADRIIGRP